MKILAVIISSSQSKWAFEPLYKGRSSFEMACDFALSLPDCDETFFFPGGDYPLPELIKSAQSTSEDTHSLLLFLNELSECCDAFVCLPADAPFLNRRLYEKMRISHERYLADYTFADGYPPGVAPEIVSSTIIKRLMSLAEEAPISNDFFFKTISKDINSFAIETEIAEKDLRMMRVSLHADEKRNFSLLKKMISAGYNPEDLPNDFLVSNEEITRSLPASFLIQIAEECPQECFYCPYPQMKKEESKGLMAINDFKATTGKIKEWCDDAVITLSPWGEPSLHPDVCTIMESILETPGLSVVIETSGIGWEKHSLETLIKNGGDRLRWIISMDADDPILYRRLRGEGQERALAFIERLSEAGANFWVQAVRMQQNDEDTENFFKKWEAKKIPVIIQKYNDFAGLLPQRQVTDLSPLERIPCRRLRREMVILTDGNVPLCIQDTAKLHTAGNAFNEPLEIIWRRGEVPFSDHVNCKYPSLCEKCDEYYIFNF